MRACGVPRPAGWEIVRFRAAAILTKACRRPDVGLTLPLPGCTIDYRAILKREGIAWRECSVFC